MLIKNFISYKDICSPDNRSINYNNNINNNNNKIKHNKNKLSKMK